MNNEPTIDPTQPQQRLAESDPEAHRQAISDHAHEEAIAATQPQAKAASETPRTDAIFSQCVSDVRNDGTYTLKLDEGETRELFAEVGIIERELAEARAEVARLHTCVLEAEQRWRDLKAGTTEAHKQTDVLPEGWDE